jgi:RES domain
MVPRVERPAGESAWISFSMTARLLRLWIRVGLQLVDLSHRVIDAGHRARRVVRRQNTSGGGRSLEATAVLIKATTARSAHVEDPAFGPTQALIQRLLSQRPRCGWWILLLFDSVAWRIYRELDASAEGWATKREYFRGRLLNEGEAVPSDFGPPPGRRVGRYNERGHRAWYLSRTAPTAAAEMRGDADRRFVAIQRFNFTGDGIRVARVPNDLSERAPYLYYFMMGCENTEESGLGAAYLRPTHFLAAACRHLSIGALEYPSVRGRFPNEPNAINLVVFDRSIDGLLTDGVGAPFVVSRE